MAYNSKNIRGRSINLSDTGITEKDDAAIAQFNASDKGILAPITTDLSNIPVTEYPFTFPTPYYTRGLISYHDNFQSLNVYNGFGWSPIGNQYSTGLPAAQLQPGHDYFLNTLGTATEAFLPNNPGAENLFCTITIHDDGADFSQNNLDVKVGAAVIDTLNVKDSSTTFVWTPTGWKATRRYSHTFRASDLTILDETDATKVARFDVSNLTTDTTQTYSFPDESGTLALGDYAAGEVVFWNAAQPAYDNTTSDSPSPFLFTLSPMQYVAFAFTAESSGDVTSVTIRLREDATPLGLANYTVEIRSATAGLPDAIPLGSATENIDLTDTLTDYTFNFSSPVTLSNGQDYFITVTSPDVSSNFLVEYQDSGSLAPLPGHVSTDGLSWLASPELSLPYSTIATIAISSAAILSSEPVLDITRGGTGLGTLGTSGQALKVNDAQDALEYGLVMNVVELTDSNYTFTSLVENTVFVANGVGSVEFLAGGTNCRLVTGLAQSPIVILSGPTTFRSFDVELDNVNGGLTVSGVLENCDIRTGDLTTLNPSFLKRCNVNCRDIDGEFTVQNGSVLTAGSLSNGVIDVEDGEINIQIAQGGTIQDTGGNGARHVKIGRLVNTVISGLSGTPSSQARLDIGKDQSGGGLIDLGAYVNATIQETDYNPQMPEDDTSYVWGQFVDSTSSLSIESWIDVNLDDVRYTGYTARKNNNNENTETYTVHGKYEGLTDTSLTFTPIPGLVLSQTYKRAMIEYSIEGDAYEAGNITAIYDANGGNWIFNVQSAGNSGISFNIDTNGQVQYSSGAFNGTLRWKIVNSNF